MSSSENHPGRQVFQVTIHAPVQAVWEALTKEQEVLPFFFGSVLHTTRLAPGAPIRMRSPDGKYTGVVGDVLEFDPPRRYSHTFRFTNLNDPECVVIYELEPTEEGTRFTLITQQVPVGTKTEKYMASGGEFITKTLKAQLEGKRLPLMSRFILFMSWVTAPLTPKKCLSTHWPLENSSQASTTVSV